MLASNVYLVTGAAGPVGGIGGRLVEILRRRNETVIAVVRVRDERAEKLQAIVGPLAFLFVPISTITYLTLPQRFRSDGAALYAMARNVFGAIGVSLSQAAVVERTQSDQAQVAKFMTPSIKISCI